MPSTPLKIAILQHSNETPPGSCLEWALKRGHTVSLTKLHAGDSLPDLRHIDWIIVLGGAMNVDDVDLYPWLRTEKSFLKDAIVVGKTCLGLCLGGQLLAQVLGATVEKNAHWEVGWKEVEIADLKMRVFQYHQDQFSLPAGAERLATNGITLNQAYTYGDHVVGFQFHPEADETWVRYCASDKELPPSGPFVDTPAEILAGLKYLPPMRDYFFDLLNQMEAHCLERKTS